MTIEKEFEYWIDEEGVEASCFSADSPGRRHLTVDVEGRPMRMIARFTSTGRDEEHVTRRAWSLGRMIHEWWISLDREYDPEHGDERLCACGHEYDRHFDSYEDMAPVGCKYCDCYTWRDPDADA